MEDVFDSLPANQQEWLIQQLGSGQSIKSFIRSLITKAYVSQAGER